MKKYKLNLIFAVILLLGTMMPQFAFAADFWNDVGVAIVRALSKLIINLLSFIADLGADFFEMMLQEGFKGHQDIAKIGWTVSRDIANMFFILFMVIIAFATILRFERYGIKDLLPKVIIIALLINFSMVLCYVLIDVTNIAADFFINNSKQAIPGTADLPLSAVFIDSFKLPDLFIPLTCEHYLIERDDCYNKSIIEKEINDCVAQAEKGMNDCYATEANTEQTEEDDFWDVVVASIGSGAILLIAAFIFFAGGIMLAIRIVAIWFLVMISPLAFICYILPALRRNWQGWWTQFTRWCIFAPAYAFFIWLAAKISLEQKLDSIGKLQNSITLRNTQAINTFFSSTGNMLHFIFIGGILIGGLIAADRLGIAGARTAVTLGRKWSKGALAWTKGKILKHPKEAGYMAGGTAQQAAGRALQYFPGFKSLGRSLEARGRLTRQKTLSTKEMKTFKERVGAMSPQQRAAEIKMFTHGLPAKLAIAQVAVDKKDDLSKDTNAAKAVANAFQAFGMIKEANDVRELNPHIGKDADERGKLTDKGLTEGTHKNYRTGVFMEETAGEAGKEIATQIARKQPTVKLALESINQMRRDTRPEFENALLRAIKDDNTFEEGKNLRDRQVYAASTGKVVEAFTDKTGKVKEDAMKGFVKEIRPPDFADVDKGSISQIARYISANTARQMTRHLTTAQKKQYFDGFSDEVKNEIRKDWFPEEGSPGAGATPSPGGPTPKKGPAPQTVDLRGGTPEENAEAASKMMAEETKKMMENMKAKERKGEEKTQEAMGESKKMEEEITRAEKYRPK